jgi:hypothetical protein
VINRDTLKYYLLVIIGAPIIGGFIPTFLISALYGFPIEIITVSAIVDAIQTLIWVIPAVLVEKIIIRPIAGHYIYPETEQLELGEIEG